MNHLQAIGRLHADLARTIESLDSLRTALALYTLAAEAPARTEKPGRDRVKSFLDAHCRATRDAYIRTTALYQGYRAWCVAHAVRPIPSGKFERRLMAQGYQYSRSRRIQGKQARTWEGLTMRTGRNTGATIQ